MAHRHDLLAVRFLLSLGRIANPGCAGGVSGSVASPGVSLAASAGEHRVSRFQGAYLHRHAGIQLAHHSRTSCVADGGGRAPPASSGHAFGTDQSSPAPGDGEVIVPRHLGGIYTAYADTHQRYRFLGRGIWPATQIY